MKWVYLLVYCMVWYGMVPVPYYVIILYITSPIITTPKVTLLKTPTSNNIILPNQLVVQSMYSFEYVRCAKFLRREEIRVGRGLSILMYCYRRKGSSLDRYKMYSNKLISKGLAVKQHDFVSLFQTVRTTDIHHGRFNNDTQLNQ